MASIKTLRPIKVLIALAPSISMDYANDQRSRTNYFYKYKCWVVNLLERVNKTNFVSVSRVHVKTA